MVIICSYYKSVVLVTLENSIIPIMDSRTILFLSIAILVALALIIFLVRKNWQDGKNIQPDADDLIEEIEADKERRREKL